MYAYDKTYLEKAQIALGRMLDYAVLDLALDIEYFWKLFLASVECQKFEYGDSSIVSGRSGIEIALMVLFKTTEYKEPVYKTQRSQEYWVGWALAFFQWQSGLSFSQITKYISITEIKMLYTPYHEMDIQHFCDKMMELYRERKQQTNLKIQRLAAGFSQSELAKITSIPLRTIQQYEQRQKNINRARADYIINLSKALFCNPSDLLEK